MKTTTWFALELASLLLLASLPAYAVGVAVTPGEIAMKAVVGEETTVRIKVKNPSSDVAVFEVYPDEFASMVKATPSSFTLEAEAEAQVIVRVSAAESGQFSTMLSVVGRPLASNAFQAGSGIKVPLIIMSQPAAGGFASALAALGTSPWTGSAALLAVAAWLIYRRRGKVPTSV